MSQGEPNYGRVADLCIALGFGLDRATKKRPYQEITGPTLKFRKDFVQRRGLFSFPLKSDSPTAKSCALEFLNKFEHLFRTREHETRGPWLGTAEGKKFILERLAMLMCAQEMSFRRNEVTKRKRGNTPESSESEMGSHHQEIADETTIRVIPKQSTPPKRAAAPVAKSDPREPTKYNAAPGRSIEQHLQSTYPINVVYPDEGPDWLFDTSSTSWPEREQAFAFRYFHDRNFYTVTKDNKAQLKRFARAVQDRLGIEGDPTRTVIIRRRCRDLLKDIWAKWGENGTAFLTKGRNDGEYVKSAQFEKAWKYHRTLWINEIHGGNTGGVAELVNSEGASRKRLRGIDEISTEPPSSKDSEPCLKRIKQGNGDHPSDISVQDLSRIRQIMTSHEGHSAAHAIGRPISREKQAEKVVSSRDRQLDTQRSTQGSPSEMDIEVDKPASKQTSRPDLEVSRRDGPPEARMQDSTRPQKPNVSEKQPSNPVVEHAPKQTPEPGPIQTTPKLTSQTQVPPPARRSAKSPESASNEATSAAISQKRCEQEANPQCQPTSSVLQQKVAAPTARVVHSQNMPRDAIQENLNPSEDPHISTTQEQNQRDQGLSKNAASGSALLHLANVGREERQQAAVTQRPVEPTTGVQNHPITEEAKNAAPASLVTAAAVNQQIKIPAPPVEPNVIHHSLPKKPESATSGQPGTGKSTSPQISNLKPVESPLAVSESASPKKPESAIPATVMLPQKPESTIAVPVPAPTNSKQTEGQQNPQLKTQDNKFPVPVAVAPMGPSQFVQDQTDHIASQSATSQNPPSLFTPLQYEPKQIYIAPAFTPVNAVPSNGYFEHHTSKMPASRPSEWIWGPGKSSNHSQRSRTSLPATKADHAAAISDLPNKPADWDLLRVGRSKSAMGFAQWDESGARVARPVPNKSHGPPTPHLRATPMNILSQNPNSPITANTSGAFTSGENIPGSIPGHQNLPIQTSYTYTSNGDFVDQSRTGASSIPKSNIQRPNKIPATENYHQQFQIPQPQYHVSKPSTQYNAGPPSPLPSATYNRGPPPPSRSTQYDPGPAPPPSTPYNRGPPPPFPSSQPVYAAPQPPAPTYPSKNPTQESSSTSPTETKHSSSGFPNTPSTTLQPISTSGPNNTSTPTTSSTPTSTITPPRALKFILENSNRSPDHDNVLTWPEFRTLSLTSFFDLFCQRSGRDRNSTEYLIFAYNWGRRDSFTVRNRGDRVAWEDYQERIHDTFLMAGIRHKRLKKWEVWVTGPDEEEDEEL